MKPENNEIVKFPTAPSMGSASFYKLLEALHGSQNAGNNYNLQFVLLKRMTLELTWYRCEVNQNFFEYIFFFLFHRMQWLFLIQICSDVRGETISSRKLLSIVVNGHWESPRLLNYSQAWALETFKRTEQFFHFNMHGRTRRTNPWNFTTYHCRFLNSSTHGVSVIAQKCFNFSNFSHRHSSL